MADIVVFDLETTGVNTQKDRIVQLAAVLVNEKFVEQDRLVLNINPTVPIPKGASGVHGIYDKDVKDWPTFKSVAPRILKFFSNRDVAGYNIIHFDIPLLHEELRRHGLILPDGHPRVLDAFSVFKKYEKRVKGKKLTDAYRFYCEAELGEDAHNAFADTSATAAVLEMQTQRYRDHATMPVSSVLGFHDLIMGDWVDLTGKMRWNDKGTAVLNFGKFNGQSLRYLAEFEKNYLDWMLEGNFSVEVKHIIERAKEGVFPSKAAPAAPEEPKSARVAPEGREICDVCCGEAKTLTGDACICGDGTLEGLVRACRLQLLEVERDRERRDSQERAKDQLLKEINEWMTVMGFDGRGHALQQRIKRLYWPDLVEEEG